MINVTDQGTQLLRCTKKNVSCFFINFYVRSRLLESRTCPFLRFDFINVNLVIWWSQVYEYTWKQESWTIWYGSWSQWRAHRWRKRSSGFMWESFFMLLYLVATKIWVFPRSSRDWHAWSLDSLMLYLLGFWECGKPGKTWRLMSFFMYSYVKPGARWRWNEKNGWDWSSHWALKTG